MDVKFVSIGTGIRFGDSISIGINGYVGFGLTFDLTNGIRFGAGFGLGFEIYIYA